MPPDTEYVAMARHQPPEGAIKLKRLRDLDVDGAKAEWHVAEKVIVLLA